MYQIATKARLKGFINLTYFKYEKCDFSYLEFDS